MLDLGAQSWPHGQGGKRPPPPRKRGGHPRGRFRADQSGHTIFSTFLSSYPAFLSSLASFCLYLLFVYPHPSPSVLLLLVSALKV